MCEHGPELLAARRQMEERRRDRRRRVFALDHPGALELAEPVGEEVRRDSGQPVTQVGVATPAA